MTIKEKRLGNRSLLNVFGRFQMSDVKCQDAQRSLKFDI